jgi:hypothetical protein
MFSAISAGPRHKPQWRHSQVKSCEDGRGKRNPGSFGSLFKVVLPGLNHQNMIKYEYIIIIVIVIIIINSNNNSNNN